jgi:mRNA-degrading endonuclease RelE of RelBE toxin-antitoxin system
MAWRVEITPEASAELKKLGATEAQRIHFILA